MSSSLSSTIQENDPIIRYLVSLETPETQSGFQVFSYQTFKALAGTSSLTGLQVLLKRFGTRSMMMGCLLSFLHSFSLGSSKKLAPILGDPDGQLTKMIILDWHVYSYHCRSVNSHFVLWSDVVAGRQSSERKKISGKKTGGAGITEQSHDLSDEAYYSRVYHFWADMARDHLRILFDARPELLWDNSPSIREDITSMQLEKVMVLTGFSGTDNLTLQELLSLCPPSYLEAVRTLACLRSIGSPHLVLVPNEILIRILASFLPLRWWWQRVSGITLKN